MTILENANMVMFLMDAVDLTLNESGTKYTKYLSIREKNHIICTKNAGWITEKFYDYCKRRAHWRVRVFYIDGDTVRCQII